MALRVSPIPPIPIDVVLLNICRYLTLYDLGIASKVSRHWREVFRCDGAVEHIRAHIVSILPAWEKAVFEQSHRYTWWKLEHYIAPIQYTMGRHFNNNDGRRQRVIVPIMLLVLSPAHHAILAPTAITRNTPNEQQQLWQLDLATETGNQIYIHFDGALSVNVAIWHAGIRKSITTIQFLESAIKELFSLERNGSSRMIYHELVSEIL
jgi:hypothetical protein